MKVCFFLHSTFTVFWMNKAFIHVAVHSSECCGPYNVGTLWASGLYIFVGYFVAEEFQDENIVLLNDMFSPFIENILLHCVSICYILMKKIKRQPVCLTSFLARFSFRRTFGHNQ